VRQIADSALTDERYRSKILNNEQHFFTRRGKYEIAQEKMIKSSGIMPGLRVLLR
jgi:bifunctional pyridoxal-dependent enzyme with beta-cystathionase and maltose regulon repressor activities